MALTKVNGDMVALTAADVGLNSVTNESKATMFTSPTFTGTVVQDAGLLDGYVNTISGSSTSAIGSSISNTSGTNSSFAISTVQSNGASVSLISGRPAATETINSIETSAAPLYIRTIGNHTYIASGYNSSDNIVKFASDKTTTFYGSVSGITQSMVGLGNVTNESKATMFTSPTFTGTVTMPAGSASAAPLLLQSGTVKTTPQAGALEYDGSQMYATTDSVGQRGCVQTQFMLRLDTNLTRNIQSLGNTVDWFGTPSAIPMVANTWYEIEWKIWYSQVDSAFLSTGIFFNKLGGGTANSQQWRGTQKLRYQFIGQYNSGGGLYTSDWLMPDNGFNLGGAYFTSTGPGYGSVYELNGRVVVYSNATQASSARLQLNTSSTGITVYSGSYLSARKLPTNTGGFVTV